MLKLKQSVNTGLKEISCQIKLKLSNNPPGKLIPLIKDSISKEKNGIAFVIQNS
jgi:hypothetical protein